jgi:hypothetical protein
MMRCASVDDETSPVERTANRVCVGEVFEYIYCDIYLCPRSHLIVVSLRGGCCDGTKLISSVVAALIFF